LCFPNLENWFNLFLNKKKIYNRDRFSNIKYKKRTEGVVDAIEVGEGIEKLRSYEKLRKKRKRYHDKIKIKY